MHRDSIHAQPQEGSILPINTTDAMLIGMWLHELADSTKEAYMTDIQQFLEHAGVSLQQVMLPHLYVYKDELQIQGLEPATVARKLKAVKSLLTFASKTGYTRFNVGAVLKVPKLKNELAERLLTEEQTFSIIHEERWYSPRNYLLLRLLYVTGARVSEICNLRWKDIQPRGETGQVALFGKGGKTRFVLLKLQVYRMLVDFRADAPGNTFVFQSRGGNGRKRGNKIDTSQVYRIVERAAIRAKVALYEDEKGRTRSYVSPHWLRHAHATHAMENGASMALIRDTLGHESIETTSKYSHAHPDQSSAQYLKM